MQLHNAHLLWPKKWCNNNLYHGHHNPWHATQTRSTLPSSFKILSIRTTCGLDCILRVNLPIATLSHPNVEIDLVDRQVRVLDSNSLENLQEYGAVRRWKTPPERQDVGVELRQWLQPRRDSFGRPSMAEVSSKYFILNVSKSPVSPDATYHRPPAQQLHRQWRRAYFFLSRYKRRRCATLPVRGGRSPSNAVAKCWRRLRRAGLDRLGRLRPRYPHAFENKVDHGVDANVAVVETNAI